MVASTSQTLNHLCVHAERIQVLLFEPCVEAKKLRQGMEGELNSVSKDIEVWKQILLGSLQERLQFQPALQSQHPERHRGRRTAKP